MVQVVLHGFENVKEQYLVKPDDNWCSCGIWQDNMYPCRHACAYFKRTLKVDYELMVSVYVSELYKYGSLQELYKNNIRPVMTDNIKKDKETRPPDIGGAI